MLTTIRWVYDTGVSYDKGVALVNHSEYTCVKGPTSNCSYAGIFDVGYGGVAGTQVAGNVTWDAVTISGSTVAAMGVEKAYQAGTLADWAPDGILGMSFGINNDGMCLLEKQLKGTRLAYNYNVATPKQPTFMERLMPTLSEPVFGVEFVSTPTSKLANVEFGFINQTKAREGLVTVPVKKTIWMLDDVSFTIGDHPASWPPVSDSGKPITMSLMFGACYFSQLPNPYDMVVKGAAYADTRMNRHRRRPPIGSRSSNNPSLLRSSGWRKSNRLHQHSIHLPLQRRPPRSPS